MMSLLHDLSGSLAVLAVCALAIGLLFEVVAEGPFRAAAVGLAAGLAVVAAFALTGYSEAALLTTGAAALAVTGLFAGPLAAAVGLVFPLALHVELGGGHILAVGLALVAAATGGSLRGLAHRRASHAVTRRSVLVLSGLMPLLLVPSLDLWGGEGARLLLPLALWLPFSTAVFGLIVLGERGRTRAQRSEAREAALLRETRQVSAELFDTQVRHHWQLHDRYGAQFGYMIAAIDEGTELRRTLPPATWHGLRAQVGKLVREAVRDGDICGPLTAARIGIVLPYIGPASMSRVAARIRDNVADAGIDCGMPVTVSVGMAHVNEANGPDDLRVLAESALVIARASNPRGAIGPPHPSHEVPTLVRTFPGLVLAPSTGQPPPAPAHRRNAA